MRKIFVFTLAAFFVGVVIIMVDVVLYAMIEGSTKVSVFDHYVHFSSHGFWRSVVSMALCLLVGSFLGNMCAKKDKALCDRDRARDLLQEELQSSDSKQLEIYFANAPIGVVEWDERFCVRKWNRIASKIFGYDAHEAIEMSASDFVEEEYQENLRILLRSFDRNNRNVHRISKNITKNGEIVYCEWHFMPVFDSERRLISIYSLVIDITKRKKAEIALRENTAKLESILSAICDFVCVIESDGTISYANRYAYEEMGVSGDQRGNLNLADFLSPEDLRIAYTRIQKVVVSGESLPPYEYFLKKSDGLVVPIEVNTTPLREDGVVKALIVGRVTLERKQLEEERQKIQKIESIGALAGGIAHDFNNTLTGIMGLASLCTVQVLEDEGACKCRAQEIIRAARRATSLTNQLLTFAKGGASKKEVDSVGRAIEETASFALSKGSPSACQLDIADDLWNAFIDYGQICRVIQNLVINADQAMPEGGIVKIVAKNVSLADGEVRGLDAGSYIHFFVKDSGIGISEEYLGKIFDPYFTTKKIFGSSCGLGLSIVYSVIQKHDGQVLVNSRPGKGTTFHLYLPAVKDVMKSERSKDVQKSSDGRRVRILIMDDEVLVRKTLDGLLRGLGHDICVTENGEEALGVYQEHQDSGKPFDIVMLDLTIPGGWGGVKTLEEMRKINGSVVAIAMSGYSHEEPRDFNRFLSKPFTFDELYEALDYVIVEFL